jgi:hypothetical protein
MRWKYPDPEDVVERGRREKIIKLIDSWWSEFRSKAQDIEALFNQQQKWDLAKWMQDHLQKIDLQLMWEFGPGVTGGHRLVITPESERQLRPLVEIILKRAPTLPGWEFYQYRLPEDADLAVQTVKARTGGDISRTMVKGKRGALNRVDLTFAAPGYRGHDDEKARGDCFVACETLLGEEVLDTWIGYIDVADKAPADGEFLPIAELLSVVKGLIAEEVKSLPDKPCHETSNSSTWTMLKLEPEKLSDYPGQSDMFLGKTMLVEMWRCAHGGQEFDSKRYSKHDEVFAYVKLDGSQGLDQEKFADKAAIEDALDAVLLPNGVGAVIGGGTGLKYSYIDLALIDVPKAIELIKICLKNGNVPKRSWILFFDAYLLDEWIGIWKDSPPPPR